MTVITATSPRISADQLADAVARAHTYAQYDAGMPTNRDLMRENHSAAEFEAAERQAITALKGPVTVLAIVEDWCPDVIANLPIFARIEEVNPSIILRVLFRPEHEALANAYPGAGDRSHIPTYVVFSRIGEELGVLIERPAAITDKIRDYGAAAIAEKARLFPGMPREQYPAEWARRRTQESHEFRNQFRDLERREIVSWLTQVTGS